MNYYEELGLTPDATPDDVHRAHRKLTRLLHPDQQTDESLRVLAEAQMRRLNSIVEVLTDSERRKQYDKGVNAPAERHHAVHNYTQTVNTVAMPVGMERRELRQVLWTLWRRLPWWVWSTAAALVLTSAAVWFFADDLGSSFGGKAMAYVPVQDPAGQSSGASVGPPPATSTRESRAEARLQELTAKLRGVFETKPEAPRAAAGESQTGSKPSAKKEPVPVSQLPPTSEQASQPPPPIPTQPKAANHAEPAHDSDAVLARLTPPKVDAAPNNNAPPPVVQLSNPAKVGPPPQPTPSPAVGTQNASVAASIPGNRATAEPAPVVPVRSGFEGEWIYAPKKPEKRKPGLYPPDFIELKLFRSQGGLHGSYRARYQVDESRRISPEVSFRLMSPEEDAKMLSWEGDNGSKGWFKLNSVDKWTIKVQWQTTVYSKQPGLTAGVATLVRR
jgi:curved DNA-binding protein CbpA